MEIIDLRCAVIGGSPVVRLMTDAGIDGFAQVEHYKPYLKPFILHLRDAVLGQDPTDVERVMLRIRQRGAFKPWGSAVSVIEMAMWDLAGKAAGVPVYKLLGGKVRDQVRVYSSSAPVPMTGSAPEDYAEAAKQAVAGPEGFSLIKRGVAFHSPMRRDVAGFHLGAARSVPLHVWTDRGMITERGMGHLLECVEALKDGLGSSIGLALDCGPGWALSDAIRFARAVERHNLLWLEDLLTGDSTPYVDAEAYRDLTLATSTPIHTGEQIYLRQNFKALIQTRAVSVVGPDPCDVGGIAELKWIAEFADLHGVMIAPHGIGDGLLGLAALVQVCATLPDNFIAFEYPRGHPSWWYDIVDGLPDPIVRDGMIDVWDRPGMGVTINAERARPYLLPEDSAFFD